MKALRGGLGVVVALGVLAVIIGITLGVVNHDGLNNRSCGSAWVPSTYSTSSAQIAEQCARIVGSPGISIGVLIFGVVLILVPVLIASGVTAARRTGTGDHP